MKKTISILSIIAIVLSVLSLLWAVVLLFVFWEPICMLLGYTYEEIIAEGPILPIGDAVYIVDGIALIVVTYICSIKSKTIVGEVVSAILLSIVFPIVTFCLSIVQTMAIAEFSNTILSALNIAKQVSTFARGLMSVAVSLCFVVCGMSISKKVIAKRTASKESKAIE